MTPQEETAAVLGHSLRSLADEMKDLLKRSALQWGAFADKLDELERLHYDLYSLRNRLDALVSDQGADDRRV